MKIIKKGIEKRYYPDTTPNLKGFVVERVGYTLFIVDSTAVVGVKGDAVVVMAVCRSFGLFLSVTMQLFEGDIITTGAIIDNHGVEQTKIEIIKYL